MAFSDIDEQSYESRRHNAWDEEQLSEDVLAFYGDARRLAHDMFLERLQALVQPGSLLDIGCGLGLFLARATEYGWDVYGCDTSAHWASRAGELVGRERITVGPASEEAFIGQTFDVITLWDVIEHVFDPVALLRTVRGLLAPGGIAFLRTPNFNYVWPIYGLRRHALRQDVELGPLNHVVYFRPSTMRDALWQAGLRDVQWPVLAPPQVSVAGVRISVRVKNTYARMADSLSTITRGRVATGSDLDVIARA